METKNIYPIDIFSVYKYGFEKWQEEFFWPCHHNWFLELQEDIKNIFLKFIDQNDNDIGDTVLIISKILYEVSNILYAVKVTQELKDKRIIYSNKSLYFKGLVEKGVPEFTFMEKVKSRKTLWKQILIAIAKLRDNILYRIYFLMNKIPSATVGEVFKREYFLDLPQKPLRLLLNGIVFENKIPLSQEMLKTIEDTAERFTSDVRIVADKYSVALTSEQIQFIYNFIFYQFKKTAEDYLGVKQKLKKIKKFHLYSGAHGVYFIRVLGQALRRMGGKATAFTHGYDIYPCVRHSYCFWDWSTVDEYIVGVKSSMERMKKVIAEYPLPRNNKVKFISENSHFFLNLYNQKRKVKLPEKIKTVVIMGFSYRTDVVRMDQVPDLVLLDYETRLIDFLLKYKYKVIYKKHPHGLLRGDVIKIFSEKASIIYERFEDVMDIGDALLFSSVGSTTWAQAICTQKPIIYINNGWHDIWFSEIYESVKKRCRIVKGGFDDRNRLIFDEKELLDALAQKPEQPNTEFIEKYTFPEKFSTSQI